MQLGERYHRLLVTKLIPDSKNPKAECLCDCGKVVIAQRGSLKNGKTKSCGCKKIEDFVSMARTHGMSATPTYKTWVGMLARCSNTRLKEYKNYGGRGIRVMWSNFEEFMDDMGIRPDGFQIDRINNDGHYEKDNCKWVLPKENLENKRTSKFWIIDSVIYDSSKDAAKALNVNTSVIVRGCNGYKRNNKYYPPRKGWSCAFKY